MDTYKKQMQVRILQNHLADVGRKMHKISGET